MAQLSPALFSPDPHASNTGKRIFTVISDPVKTISILVRNERFADFERNVILPKWQEFLNGMGPLLGLVDQHQFESTVIPADTWHSAYTIREALLPMRDELSWHYLNPGYDNLIAWRVEEGIGKRAAKRPKCDIERDRKRIEDTIRKKEHERIIEYLVEFRKDFADERLMLDLHKAIAKDFPVLQEVRGGQTAPRHRDLQSTAVPPKLPAKAPLQITATGRTIGVSGTPGAQHATGALVDPGPNGWSRANSPTYWGKVFGFSCATFKRRVDEKKIRANKLSTKNYQIAVDDIPADKRAQYLPAK